MLFFKIFMMLFWVLYLGSNTKIHILSLNFWAASFQSITSEVFSLSVWSYNNQSVLRNDTVHIESWSGISYKKYWIQEKRRYFFIYKNGKWSDVSKRILFAMLCQVLKSKLNRNSLSCVTFWHSSTLINSSIKTV